jgi:hypothetical protein
MFDNEDHPHFTARRGVDGGSVEALIADWLLCRTFPLRTRSLKAPSAFT